MSGPFETRVQPGGAQVSARGRDLPELFIHAALGLTSLLADPSTVRAGGIRDRVRAQAADPRALLSAWLDQILFLFRVQNMVFGRFQVRSLSDTAIEAEAEGELLDPGRHAVLRDAATTVVQDADVRRTTEGWAASFFLRAR